MSAAASTVCSGDTPVMVTTRDGRVLHGVVDAQTNDGRLWVRRDEGGVALASSVGWDDVTAAEVAGSPVDVAELRARRDDLATAAIALAAMPPAAPQEPLVEELPAPAAPRQRQRLRSIEVVDACLANLDYDVEPDGLIVSLVALDQWRRPMAVRGSLAVRLFGQRQSNRTSQLEFGDLDRWSQRVLPEDFVDGVATFELRFRRTAPEWQFDLLPDAVIDVRLGAFGEGNFAAATPVFLRPYNPLRDNLQLYEGTRFAPREWRGREPASMPSRVQGLWVPWQY